MDVGGISRILISNELHDCLLIATYPPQHTQEQTKKKDPFCPSKCLCNKAVVVKIELSKTYTERKPIVFLHLPYLGDRIVLQYNRWVVFNLSVTSFDT